MIPSLLPLIAPPASVRVRGPLSRRPVVADRTPARTWIRGPLSRRPVVADRTPARTWVRGPLGRRPVVADRAPRECQGTRASGPTPCGR